MGEVQRTMTIPADRDRVWDAVVDGTGLGDDVRLDARAGGEGVIRDGAEIRYVVVEDAEPGQRLVFRWWVLGPGGVGAASRVSITLEPCAAAEAGVRDRALGEQDEATQVVVVEAPVLHAAPLPPSGPLALARI